MPHMFEWIEMEIAKNREEYGLIKTDLPKQVTIQQYYFPYLHPVTI